MKFTNGHWLLKEGYALFSPAQAYFIKKHKTEVSILAPTAVIEDRGATLGGINLSLKITSPAPGILRVQTFHYAGDSKNHMSFDLALTACLPLDVAETEELLTVTSGGLSLLINKKSWEMTYIYENHYLTSSRRGDLALAKTNWRGMAYDKGDTKDTFMRQQLGLSVQESIYGLGERFTPFVKNGQTVEIWNEDGGTSTEQSYINVPFYLSNRGYGVFVNHPEKVSFEIGSELVSKVGFSVENGYLDYFLIGADSMKGVLERYTDLTGKPALPAPWTFGLWLSTSFTTNYDEHTVTGFIDGMLERDIPLRVFHFDCFWMKEFHWSDFLWDDRVFPDPAGMLKRIKEKNIKICVWINSYIAQESALFEEGSKKGYLLKRPDGTVWQWDMWQSGMGLVDFTNPDAYSWFQDKLELLLDMGVDCFKTDFGERIPLDVVYSDHSDPAKMHNYYTYLYNRCVFELLERKKGKGEAVLFARSGTVGSQKFPVHWGGDCWSNYEAMSESLRGGLSLMMSGYGFWSHDIGGFESTSTPDVYKRWVAFGLLSSHSRLHGSSSYRVPWAYDEEAVTVLRFFTKLKYRLMPYLFSQAVHTSQTGISLMRSMVMEYADDPCCDVLSTQYMLGERMLVSPVFNGEGMASYYLPKGRWTSFLDHRQIQGGCFIKEYHDYTSLPLLVRENTILPVGAVDNRPDYDFAKEVELRVYEPSDREDAFCTIYHDHAVQKLSAQMNRKNNLLTIHVEAAYSFTIRLVNLKAQSAQNASLSYDKADTLIVPVSGASHFEIIL